MTSVDGFVQPTEIENCYLGHHDTQMVDGDGGSTSVAFNGISEPSRYPNGRWKWRLYLSGMQRHRWT
ncbi:hypothetical protein AVEN_64915-1, partial [Araneus ventricosus]